MADVHYSAIALAMGMRPVIWTSSMQGVAPGGSAIQWDSQDWRVHAGTVQPVPNQAAFQSVLDSTGQFATGNTSTPHGVIVLQHDIYVEAVNLAIGYTVPFVLQHQPPFKVKTVTECQNRPLGDAYLETNTDPNNPSLQGGGVVITPTVINGVTTTITSSSTGRPTGGSTNTDAAGRSITGSLAGLLVAGAAVVVALF